MRALLTFTILLTLWCILSGLFDAFHLTLGVFSCALITLLSNNYLYAEQQFNLRRILLIGWRFIPYGAWLLKEIFLANVHVFWIAMTPGGLRYLNPEIIQFTTRLSSPIARYLLANSITLTPGTVTVKLKDAIFCVHSISAHTTKGLEGEMENRIARVFGETLTGQTTFQTLTG